MSAVLKPQERFAPMTEADLDAVIAIEREIYDFPWTRGNFRDSIRSGYSCWVYRADFALIGYAVLMLGAEEAHLLNLSVAARAQRHGYGARLLEHLLGVAREAGARLLFLEVRPSNLAAQRLYARFGFHRIGVRRGYYPARNGREDALVLARDL